MAESRYVSTGPVPDLFGYGLDNDPSLGMLSPITIDGYRSHKAAIRITPVLEAYNSSMSTYETAGVFSLDDVYKKAWKPRKLRFFGEDPVCLSRSGSNIKILSGIDTYAKPAGVSLTFRDGAASSLEAAVGLILDLCNKKDTLKNVSQEYYLYYGKDVAVANWVYSKFESTLEETEYKKDDGSIDYTLYTVLGKNGSYAHRYDITGDFEYYIGNEGSVNDNGAPEEIVYHKQSNHYSDFNKGTTRQQFDDHGKMTSDFPNDLDLRLVKMPYFHETVSNTTADRYYYLYSFKTDRDNNNIDKISFFRYRKCNTLKMFDNNNSVYRFMFSKNKLMYDFKDVDDIDSKYDASKKFGEDDRFYSFYKKQNLLCVYNVKDFDAVVTSDTAVDRDHGIVCGFDCLLVKLFCFHFGDGDVFLAAQRPDKNNLFYKVVTHTDSFAKYKIENVNTSMDKTNDYFCIPGCGMRLFRRNGKLYLLSKRASNLTVSKAYADNNTDTYTYGSTSNKFDPANPAMARMKIIEIQEKKKEFVPGDSTYNVDSTEYKYIRSEENDDIDPDKYFVESLGLVAVYRDDGKSYRLPASVSECVDLFLQADPENRKRQKTTVDVGLTFA